MNWLFDFMPWWGWFTVSAVAGIVSMKWFGLPGLLAFLGIGALKSASAYGRKTGVAAERGKQVAADNKARETIHDVKEDVRSIPDTPAGKAERDKRFDRWL